MTTPLASRRVARLAGEIDAANADEIVAMVAALPAGPRHLDATEVTFAGSAALRAIERACEMCEREGAALTIAPSSALRRVAEAAGAGHLPFV